MSSYGLHRVAEPVGVLPQQAQRLDTSPEPGPDEVVVDVECLNLDAASFRQLREQYGDGDAIRNAVLDIVRTRGKMHNPRYRIGWHAARHRPRCRPAVAAGAQAR
ncbi:hypothetical protein [Kibdelosporangium aridum]|uniref:hypothetical protein n=1 Tax=Kibdelosporangium aridum TaxID=2030 RepID=UPI0035F0EF70